MKYIIVENPTGLAFPVFCLAPKTHAELAAAWKRGDSSRVISAGFCEFLPQGVRTFGRSTSLNVGPRAVDARLIAAFYNATLAMGTAQERHPAGRATTS